MEGRQIRVSFGELQPRLVIRCAGPFSADQAERGLAPTTRNLLGPGRTGRSLLDGTPPEGVDLYYGVSDGDSWSTVGPVRLPSRALPHLAHPALRIDKSLYTLTMLDDGRPVKRYPVVFGSAPLRRKFEFDNASTPEGRYTIHNLQPQATYHRAYDLDYPLACDQARHQLLGSQQPIGGEIQIHGRGIRRNWTFGCTALRDGDVDELFAHPEIGVGTPVWIAGGELTWDDLASDAQGALASPLELGQFQKRHGLPISCLSDRATRLAWTR